MTDHLRWRLVRETQDADHRIFTLRRRRAAHPVTEAERTFTVIDCADWVNVIALTPDDAVVLVRQYRHGTDAITLEIPGGMVDPGEAPLEAARRELEEETGYRAERWLSLGEVAPNPAIQSNRCSTYLALDARPIAGQRLDPGEVIDVETTPLLAIPGLIRGGAIDHALVVAGFFHLLERAGGWRRPER